MGVANMRFASSSSGKISRTGSQRRSRPRLMAIVPMLHSVVERWPTSTGAFGSLRVRMQSTQFWKWSAVVLG